MRGHAFLILLSMVSAPVAQAMPWEEGPPLADGEAFVVGSGGERRDTVENAKREGLLVVDLSDEWTPFLFSDADGPGAPVKPNEYKKTFVALANDRMSPDELVLEGATGRAAVLATVPEPLRSPAPKELSAAERKALERARGGLSARRTPNFLEVYGIPPTLSVLARRVEEDAAKTCYASVDVEGLRLLDFEISYQGRDEARRDYSEAIDDAAWVAEKLSPAPGTSPEAFEAGLQMLESDPQARPRAERYRRGETRLRAVRAVQTRLVCEGLLAPERFQSGVFDVATNEALAEFERKNDIFGWGFVSGETQATLQRPPMDLHLDTLRRILAERLADAAGIIEDGSVSKGERPATYTDESGLAQPVPNVIGDFVDRLLGAMKIQTPDDMVRFLRAMAVRDAGKLRVALAPPPFPPYYAPVMDLSAEIDRGDVWYDLPFTSGGKPLVQRRQRYPAFTLFVSWRKQKIPLVRWRTTIGSWRSELGGDGHVYLKYKNSDVGPRIWRNIVAGPVWVPPDGTPGKDLLTKKVFDRRQGPVTIVNTEVMGPGFASAYGLAMAIHLEKLPEGGVFDNKIRTHGSVDYTSIAGRFSHGCHRLVNNRAVRLFDFILKHRTFRRIGDHALKDFKRRFTHQGRRYEYELTTRGYYYDLRPPLPMMVLEGRIMGQTREPPAAYVRKPGVDYGPLPAGSPIEAVPVVGP